MIRDILEELGAIVEAGDSSMVVLFDKLKSKEKILVALKSVMGFGRPPIDGKFHEWIVGRKSVSKKFGVMTITLIPPGGKTPDKRVRVALFKRGGKVTAAKGDLALSLVGLKRR